MYVCVHVVNVGYVIICLGYDVVDVIYCVVIGSRIVICVVVADCRGDGCAVVGGVADAAVVVVVIVGVSISVVVDGVRIRIIVVWYLCW